MPPTVTPAPRPQPYNPGHKSTAPGPKAGSHSRQPAPLQARHPAADPRPRLDHPPKASRPEARPQSPPPTISRQRPNRTRPALPRTGIARAPLPAPRTRWVPSRTKWPRSTRPEAIFLHPSPAETGTNPRHQPHKKACSASSAIPRRIISAHSAPVTAPFLRLLRHHPQTPFLPFSRLQCTALRYPRRLYPAPIRPRWKQPAPVYRSCRSNS